MVWSFKNNVFFKCHTWTTTFLNFMAFLYLISSFRICCLSRKLSHIEDSVLMIQDKLVPFVNDFADYDKKRLLLFYPHTHHMHLTHCIQLANCMATRFYPQTSWETLHRKNYVLLNFESSVPIQVPGSSN